jgi:hypothetical protein
MVFDDGQHTAPQMHPVPFQATLLYVPGALLRNGRGQTPADWDEVTLVHGRDTLFEYLGCYWLDEAQ